MIRTITETETKASNRNKGQGTGNKKPRTAKQIAKTKQQQEYIQKRYKEQGTKQDTKQKKDKDRNRITGIHHNNNTKDRNRTESKRP